MNKEKLLQALPIWSQNMLQTYFIFKDEKDTLLREQLELYESHNSWSYDQKCEYRDNQLRKMVLHAYKTVPYYKRVFDDGGINPESIRTIDDLKVLPIITKDMVVANPQDFQSSTVNLKKIRQIHTSGTTGSGFIFNSTTEAHHAQWAVWRRYWRNLGMMNDCHKATFTRTIMIPPTQTKPPYYRVSKHYNNVMLSSFHLNEANVDSYLEALEKYNIKWIHGWPSMIDAFANILISKGISFQLDKVTTGAENLLDTQVEHIKKAFGVTPYQHYGQMEAVANFSQDINHDMYVDEDFAAVEFLPVGEGRFEIIGTNITNYATPFLRYKTKDLCEYKETKNGRLITRLDGRLEDYILLPNGVKIGRLDDLFVSFEKVRESQVVQTTKQDLTVRIVRREGYCDNDEKRILKRLKDFLPGLNVQFDYVDEIEKSRSGKLRHIVSNIK